MKFHVRKDGMSKITLPAIPFQCRFAYRHARRVHQLGPATSLAPDDQPVAISKIGLCTDAMLAMLRSKQPDELLALE